MNPSPTLRRILLHTGAAIALLMVLAAVFGPARADASDALNHVLARIHQMAGNDVSSLVDWAKGSMDAPGPDPAFEPQKTEVEILALDSGDRNALVAWLKGNGRAALHAQGASDADIGPARSGLDAPGASATPNAWRSIPLATTSLDAAPQGHVQILGGFAAAKRDGTSAIACISFKNLDPRVAKHIVFAFPLLGDNGQVLGTVQLERTGEFSPNVDIRSFDSMAAWQSGGVGPRGSFMQSCIQRDLPTAAVPFLQARAVGYAVTRVDYADGTSWGASAAPAAAAPAQ